MTRCRCGSLGYGGWSAVAWLSAQPPALPWHAVPTVLCLLCCAAGVVPGLTEANTREPLMPWSDPHNGRVVLGACVEDACSGPEQLRAALAAFSGETQQ